jgi:hypothetical protein
MRSVSILLVCLSVGGCVGIQAREAREAFGADVAECKARWPEITRETALPYAHCISDAEEATILPTSGSMSDLVAQRIALRNVLAERVAAGQITPAEASLQLARSNSEMNSEAMSRTMRMEQANAARAQSAAALANAFGGGHRQVTTNCMNFGNQTSCTSQ